LFIKIFNSVSINQRTGSADIPRPPEQRLATLTALPRQAFLLMVLEGFSEEDGAKILECDIPICAGWLTTRGASLPPISRPMF
jgi:hypothetical protein